MGYFIEAFICRQNDADVFLQRFNQARKIDLAQGLSLLPMTEELFDQINQSQEPEAVMEFEYLTEKIEQELLETVGGRKYAYVEALYHGGHGGQMAVIWEGGKRIFFGNVDQGRINYVLKSFGVTANPGEDEFITMGFGLRRSTKDWLDNENKAQ